MFKRIKDFLIRWDLMPILWPFGPGSEAGFLGAILSAAAPVVASWLAGKGKEKDARAQAQARAQYDFEQQEAQRQAAFAAAQNSPQAQAARFAATMRLGRLGGAMGGMGRVPPSIAAYLGGARTAQEYTPGTYVEPQIPGSSFLSQLAGGLSYLDPRGIQEAISGGGGGGGGAPAPAAAPPGMVPPVSTAGQITPGSPIDTGFFDLSNLRPQTPAGPFQSDAGLGLNPSLVQPGRKPFDPKLGR